MQRAFRWFTDTLFELMMVSAVLNYRYFRRLNIAASDLSKINRFVSIRDKELRAKLTPSYDFGCKRPTYSNSYYRSFTKPHVHLQTGTIERIEAACLALPAFDAARPERQPDAPAAG